MDSPTERMPIACVHCAKAKAKCDKKVSLPTRTPLLAHDKRSTSGVGYVAIHLAGWTIVFNMTVHRC